MLGTDLRSCRERWFYGRPTNRPKCPKSRPYPPSDNHSISEIHGSRLKCNITWDEQSVLLFYVNNYNNLRTSCIWAFSSVFVSLPESLLAFLNIWCPCCVLPSFFPVPIFPAKTPVFRFLAYMVDPIDRVLLDLDDVLNRRSLHFRFQLLRTSCWTWSRFL